MFWKEQFLKIAGNFVADNFGKIQYCINGNWSDVRKLSEKISGTKHTFTVEIPSAAVGTITGLRMLDKNNAIIGEKNEHIVKPYGSSFLMNFLIYVYEEDGTV